MSVPWRLAWHAKIHTRLHQTERKCRGRVELHTKETVPCGLVQLTQDGGSPKMKRCPKKRKTTHPQHNEKTLGPHATQTIHDPPPTHHRGWKGAAPTTRGWKGAVMPPAALAAADRPLPAGGGGGGGARRRRGLRSAWVIRFGKHNGSRRSCSYIMACIMRIAHCDSTPFNREVLLSRHSSAAVSEVKPPPGPRGG
jgi:hypothetical protein